jgi:LemA protein
MSKKLFGWLIGIGIFIGVVALSFAIAFTTQNKAINLEEQIKESKSSIEIQEKRRVDLILNLVDTVKDYNKHEKDTLVQLTEARSNATKGNVKEAELTLQAVTEAYPELKSQQNYKELMNELATTENLIAEHRDNYNIQVKAYNKHVRKFPNSVLLNMMGYEKMNVKYLEYNASSDAPTNLFEGK